MPELSLTEAWSLWFAGRQISDQIFLGKSILWWGRVGKIVSFLSAMTIFAEIIGPERIRIFGQALHRQFGLQQAVSQIKQAFLWLQYHMDFDIKLLEVDNKTKNLIFVIMNHIITLTLVLLTLILLRRHFVWWQLIVGGFYFYVLGTYTLGPALTIIMISLIMIFLTIIDSAFIEPVAWVLENPKLDKLIKAGSLVLLALGFHFDLLAS